MPTTHEIVTEFSCFEVEDNVFVGLITDGTDCTEYYAVFGKCANPKFTETKISSFWELDYKKPIGGASVEMNINVKPLVWDDCKFKMIKLDKKEDYEIVKRAVFAALK